MPSPHGNFLHDNEDLLFQVRHGIRWDELIPLLEPGFTDPDGPRDAAEARGFYEGSLEAVGAFSAREVAPLSRLLDTEPPRLIDGEVVFPQRVNRLFASMAELGFYGLSIPRCLGGTNGPLVLAFIGEELLARGDVSVMTDFAFHVGIASALQTFASIEGNLELSGGRYVRSRFDPIIRAIASGEAMGCMVLTEPGAGSDLAAITTTARQEGDHWRLDGEKILITSAQAPWHLVLARSERVPATGLDGLSLFLAPRRLEDGRTNVRITQLEHKLGIRSSPTCSLLFEGARAELIGQRGDGFRLMLALMNAARVSVGFEAIGNSEAVYRAAGAHAAERITMGRPLAQHELIAEKLDGMELSLRSLRALAFEAANALEVSMRLQVLARAGVPLTEAQVARQRRMARRARRLTPLLKYLAAEEAVVMARDAMQLFGGMGYIDETGIHQRLRDALVFPIYEGTSQIQALMATKDHLLRTVRDPGGFLKRLARAKLGARRAESPLWREVNRARFLSLHATETILLRILGAKVKSELRGQWHPGMRDWSMLARYLARDFLRRWDLRSDFGPGLLHAERLTRILADVAIAKILVRQAERHPERTALAERFLHRMSLRVEAQARAIEHDGGGGPLRRPTSHATGLGDAAIPGA